MSRWVSKVMVGLMLFAQMALAAYACSVSEGDPPSARGETAVISANAWSVSTSAPAGGIADCHVTLGEPAATSSSLCSEHCKYGHQSEQVPTASAPAVSLIARYHLPPPLDAPGPRPSPALIDALAGATTPHAILHCVLRT
ncbi:MAG: hypothetical protein ABIP08_03020 [Lautropia sp.]